MNWEEIKNKSPKAFKGMADWVMKTQLYHTNPFIHFFNQKEQSNAYRILYDFFDEQEIFIDTYYTLSCFRGRIGFNKHIVDSQEWLRDSVWTDKRETRTEAEQEAFTKAFEILEERLK